MLDFYQRADSLLPVNQQLRFVLSDQHWDELKKLSGAGQPSVARSGVAANVIILASEWKPFCGFYALA
jgi:hypothetical protein